jgi:hypothetical protein
MSALVKQEVDEDDKFENKESEDDMKSDKLSKDNNDFAMNDEEISKKKHQKYIVESDTDEDYQMVGMEKGVIKLGSISKSAKHEALETGERISNMIKTLIGCLKRRSWTR